MKIQVSVLGQDTSFGTATSLHKLCSDGQTKLLVSTERDNPRLMISIGGPKPTVPPPRPGRPPGMRPILVPLPVPQPRPMVPNAVVITLDERLPSICYLPGQNLIAISVGGPRPKGVPPPPPATGIAAEDLMICLDTTQGVWDIREDLVAHQIIASLSPSALPQAQGGLGLVAE